MKILTPRDRGGRPKTVCTTEQKGSTVTTYLPTEYHDRLVKIAESRGESVSSVIRSVLLVRLAR